LEDRQWAGIAALVELSAAPEVAQPEHRVDGEAIDPAIILAARGPRRLARLSGRSLAMPAILVLQAALSLRLIWSNTAYQDESLYLWAGRLELAHWSHGAAVPAFQAYFSGSPAVYPPLAALANDAGGLAAARVLSLLFMLGATCLLYGTTIRLLDRRSAIAAAALFATFGMGTELGAFATYDAMAVLLTALAAYLVVRAGLARTSEPLLVLAGAVLALAAATKYAAALWAPVVICLAALTAQHGSWPRRALRAGRVSCYAAILAVAALSVGGGSYVRGIEFTTVHRQIVTGTPPLRVLDIAWGWLALLFLLGMLGVALIWHDRGHIEVVPLVLFCAAILAPVAQARIHDVTSLHKQVVFGVWFLSAVAGYAVSRISFLDGRLSQGAIIGSVLVAVSAGTGFSQASTIYASWPSVAPAMPALGRAITSSHCPCLISQQSAAEYYLPAADLHEPVIGPYTFTYRDAATPRALSGQAAMAAAIMNGYFGAVELDGLRTPAMYRLLERSLRRSGQYRLVYSGRWPAKPQEPTQIWQLIARTSA
jgi:hypothetical protein